MSFGLILFRNLTKAKLVSMQEQEKKQEGSNLNRIFFLKVSFPRKPQTYLTLTSRCQILIPSQLQTSFLLSLSF